jgi:hypothetical protein
MKIGMDMTPHEFHETLFDVVNMTLVDVKHEMGCISLLFILKFLTTMLSKRSTF